MLKKPHIQVLFFLGFLIMGYVGGSFAPFLGTSDRAPDLPAADPEMTLDHLVDWADMAEQNSPVEVEAAPATYPPPVEVPPLDLPPIVEEKPVEIVAVEEKPVVIEKKPVVTPRAPKKASAPRSSYRKPAPAPPVKKRKTPIRDLGRAIFGPRRDK